MSLENFFQIKTILNKKQSLFKGKRLKPVTANTIKFDISPAHSNKANRILIKKYIHC